MHEDQLSRVDEPTASSVDRPSATPSQNSVTRRAALGLTAGATAGALLASGIGSRMSLAATLSTQEEKKMSPKAFVYTEVQISVPFADAPWRDINAALLKQPGLLNKTWLAGVGNNSLGGIYAFDSIENAQAFVTGYFPQEARQVGAAHNTRIFDAAVVEAASRDMDSPHFGVTPDSKPGAFVYTEVQINVPFEKAPWRDRNPHLKQQPGLMAKTWLSGLHTNTLGGIDAFDTIENAKAFALNDFPAQIAKMNAAFYTRVFDAGVAEEASRQMRSPFFI
ncbi:YdhR family protein [Pelagibius sp. Alg239-R121]|uniref:YdhR family protein n=1 Tax=Pelagibius sp. Alg239-R121 TaxID=2993448 RepID=UPI0024A71BB2|nr:YdhR family protein [Pelagibius sp. Alg239-R121]